MKNKLFHDFSHQLLFHSKNWAFDLNNIRYSFEGYSTEKKRKDGTWP